MKRVHLIIVILLSSIALVAFSWLGYRLYRQYRHPAETPFNAIPGNTALIIQLNRAGNLLGELNRSNLLWKTLSRFPGINSIRNEMNYVDSVSRKNEEISRILHQQDILVAITMSGRYNFGALYLSSISGSDPESYILSFIDELSEGRVVTTHTPYSVTQLHRVQSRQSRDAFYFAVLKGVFIGSFHADLVKRAIDRLSLNTPMATSAGFRKVQASAGKKVDANIYINYRFFSLVLSRITRDEMLPELIKISDFAEWSELDLIIKKDELLFNGITVATDSNLHFLSMFADQEPQPREITAIIPDDAHYFIAYGWSDPGRFSQRFQTRTQRDEGFYPEKSLVSSLIDHYQLNVKEYFTPWIGNQGGVFVTDRNQQEQPAGFSAFLARDTILALSSLRSLADTLGIRVDSVTYHGHRIYRIDLPNFFPALFGEVFGKHGISSFAFVNGYIVFSDRPKELERIIDAAASKRTLAYDRFYQDFEANLSEKSNVFYYYNTRIGIEGIKDLLNPDLSGQVNPMLDSLRKFESVAFQYASTEGQFYSNIFLRYNPNIAAEGPLQWQAQLDTTVTGKPRIVNTAKEGRSSVLVTDVANNLYSINADGRIDWKLHIMGRIMGDIQTIQLTGRDSLYLIFNTDTHLYLLHPDGNYADRFPMRFPINATNGITVTDWNRDGDHRILVALQDNRVYSFTLDGISSEGWKRPDLKEEIRVPATACIAGGKEYILVTGVTGNTLMMDAEGNIRINAGIKFSQAPVSGFHVNRTNRQGPLLTTSPDGKLIFVRENGKISQATLNFFTPSHRFFYTDITGNGLPEFIFSDKNTIYYYNRNYKLIYSYAFRREIQEPPFLVRGRGGKSMIGYVIPTTKELFLFDGNGYVELDPGIHGNTPFDIGAMSDQDQLCLIVGSGKKLKNYRLSKL